MKDYILLKKILFLLKHSSKQPKEIAEPKPIPFHQTDYYKEWVKGTNEFIRGHNTLIGWLFSENRPEFAPKPNENESEKFQKGYLVAAKLYGVWKVN